MSNRKPPPNLPKEEPAIPLEPAVAKARSAYVREMVEKIKKRKAEGKTIEDIRSEFSRFAEDYPQLFKMLTTGDGYNETSMRLLLNMLDKMGTGQMTQDQASVVVGQRFYDTYIKPKLDEEDKKKSGGGR